MTGRSSTKIKTPIDIKSPGGKYGFEIDIVLLDKQGVLLNIIIFGAGPCVDEGDEVNVLFKDDSKMTLKYRGDFKCEPELYFTFGSGPGRLNELAQLRTKKIATLRGWTKGSPMQMDLTEEQATAIMDSFVCMNSKRTD